MVTKTELKEQYGNSEIINEIIDTFGDENGQIIDLSQKLFGDVVYVSEDDAKEMVKSGVRRLCKDLLKKVGIEGEKIQAAGFRLEDI